MKHISRFFAAVTAALTIAVCATASVGAAEVKPCVQVKVICPSGSCDSIEKQLTRYCRSQSCNWNEILKSLGGRCPDGNCSVTQPTQPPVQPEKPIVTPTQPTVPAPTASAGVNAAYEAEVLRLVNAERAKNGLSPLVTDNGVTEVARLRAKEIVQSFSHTRPNGSSCFTAANELGVSYRAAGENIAYGYPTPEAVVNGWMHSDGHRKNILSASFSKIGIGCYESGGVLYWTQFFTD